VDFIDATSEEFVPDIEKPVIVFMPEISKTHMGGTMRLGLRPTVFDAGTEKSLARKLYAGAPTIWERHRHRYEVNPALVDELSIDGFKFIGKDEKGERMQILELESELIRSVLSNCRKPNSIFRSPILPWFPSTS
jgi:CTP synthase